MPSNHDESACYFARQLPDERRWRRLVERRKELDIRDRVEIYLRSYPGNVAEEPLIEVKKITRIAVPPLPWPVDPGDSALADSRISKACAKARLTASLIPQDFVL